LKFYREAPRDLPRMGLMSLGDYLKANGYGAAFTNDHLYPMAAAIWSIPAGQAGDYPAAAFVRFCETHGLLKLRGRPIWRTIDGGSRVYVSRLAGGISDGALTGSPVRAVRRGLEGVTVEIDGEPSRRFDHVVLASHADDALASLIDASPSERRVLGAFRYEDNIAVLHSDAALMPRRRAAWAAWNYLSESGVSASPPSVTYWMNRLQGVSPDAPYFVTLNPNRAPRPERVIKKIAYRHPVFDARAIAAQSQLWPLQGRGNVWFCGAYFGSGFHEDGLQAGLAVAEAIGGCRRPWSVPNESGRIQIAEDYEQGERRQDHMEAAQ